MKSSRSCIYLLFILSLLVLNCAPAEENTQLIVTQSGLSYEIIKKGTGEIASDGDEILIHDTMGYRDGTQLYSTKDGDPISFIIGAGQVISGVDEGVRGMKIGETRRMVVPSSLSQRTEYPDFLVPDSTLIYTIELVDITSSKKQSKK